MCVYNNLYATNFVSLNTYLNTYTGRGGGKRGMCFSSATKFSREKPQRNENKSTKIKTVYYKY